MIGCCGHAANFYDSVTTWPSWMDLSAASTIFRLLTSSILRALAAGYAHVPGQCRLVVPPVDDEIMPLGLAADRLGDGGMQKLIAFRRPERCAKIRRILL